MGSGVGDLTQLGGSQIWAGTILIVSLVAGYHLVMDAIDRKIAGILQKDSQSSSAVLAEVVGVSTSTANERVRKLSRQGLIRDWRAVLDTDAFGAKLCAFVFVDMRYEWEDEAVAALRAAPEVQEIHHVAGAHSYLLKIRVADTAALQRVLRERVKPLPAVERTESILVLETVKETSEILISGQDGAPDEVPSKEEA